MSIVVFADQAIVVASEGHVTKAQRIYKACFQKYGREVVVSTFQDRWLTAILKAGLETGDDAKRKFDNLVRAAYRLWKAKPTWERICQLLGRIACKAHKKGNLELVRAARDMMIRSRPAGLHENVAGAKFYEYTGIKIRRLPKPASPRVGWHEQYA